jgi:hypothetical protein
MNTTHEVPPGSVIEKVIKDAASGWRASHGNCVGIALN